MGLTARKRRTGEYSEKDLNWHSVFDQLGRDPHPKKHISLTLEEKLNLEERRAVVQELSRYGEVSAPNIAQPWGRAIHMVIRDPQKYETFKTRCISGAWDDVLEDAFYSTGEAELKLLY